MASQPPSYNPKDEKPSRSMPSTDNILEYFKTHLRETISYALLIVGILMIYPQPIWGGILVGLVAGIYFGDEVVQYIKNWRISGTRDVARNLISLGVAIAIFIVAPTLFLGAAISIGIKQLFVGQTNK